MKEGVSMGFSRTEHRGRLGVATCLTSLAALALAAGAVAGVRSDQAAKPPTTVSGTFHEWNWDLPVDDPGEHAMLAPWLKAIEKKFPKAKIVNTSMTLSAQNDKLPLAFASSSSAPTLSQTNEGLENQGRLVQDNLIMPLDPYDNIYHWYQRIGGKSSLALAVNSWPSSKKQ